MEILKLISHGRFEWRSVISPGKNLIKNDILNECGTLISESLISVAVVSAALNHFNSAGSVERGEAKVRL